MVVPSPATSEVFEATSFTSWAPMCSYLSLSWISSATVTPSLVIVGAPHPLSRTALRPRGPRVVVTDYRSDSYKAGEKAAKKDSSSSDSSSSSD